MGHLSLITGWEDPLEKAMATVTPVFLPEKLHGQWSLVSYIQSMGVTESDTTEHLTLTVCFIVN